VILRRPQAILWQETEEEVKGKVSWPARLQKWHSPWIGENGGDDFDSSGTAPAFVVGGGL
jgi:hypothetical protein